MGSQTETEAGLRRERKTEERQTDRQTERVTEIYLLLLRPLGFDPLQDRE